MHTIAFRGIDKDHESAGNPCETPTLSVFMEFSADPFVAEAHTRNTEDAAQSQNILGIDYNDFLGDTTAPRLLQQYIHRNNLAERPFQGNECSCDEE